MSKRAQAKDSTPYVNPGLERWNATRAKWLAEPSPAEAKEKSSANKRGEVRAKNIDVEDLVERIFSQSGSGVLAEPVPLGQLIDILIEFWEADGLYD